MSNPILVDIKLNESQAVAGGQRFIKSLEDQARAIGKTNAELLELKAAELGVSAQAAPMIAQLKATEGGLHALNVSAKQAVWAMRGVPAQMTDIVTSLAGGQNPMMVFIQQGGQLKDMFGGTGAAAKALGGYVAGLINPFSVAAVAASALALAYYKGSEEALAFQKTLILTGNAAGASSQQMMDMASSVSSSMSATQGAAAEAINQLAATGKIGAAGMAQMATAALAMEQVTGKAISETVKEFVELGKAPAEASLKLNEQYNYLTASVYRQIKALEDQGQASEAAALAQSTYATAMNERTEQLKENIGAIEGAWKLVSFGAKKAWDDMLGIGRTATISDIQDQLAFAEASGVDTSALEKKLAAMQKVAAQSAKDAAEKATQNAAEKAGIALQAESAKYLDKTAQKQRDLNLAAAGYSKAIAGAIGDQQAMNAIARDYETIVTGINAKYAEKGKSPLVKDANELERLLDSINGKAADFDSNYVKNVNTLLEGFASGKLKLEAFNDVFARYVAMQPGAVAAEKALTEASKARSELLGKMVDAETKRVDATEKSNDTLRDEIDAMGESKDQQAEYAAIKLESAAASDLATASAIEQMQAEWEINGVLPEIIAGYNALAEAKRASAAAFSDKAALTREKGAKAIAVDQAKASAKAWEKFSDDINRALTNALMRGFEDGKSFGKNFVDSLRNSLKTAGLKIVVNTVTGAIGLGGSSSASGSGGSGFNLNSSGGSIGGYMDYAGSLVGNSSLQGFGIGANLTQSQAGAASMAYTDAYMQTGDIAYQQASNSILAGNSSIFANGQSSISQGGSTFGAGLGYASALYSASQGQYGSAIGAAIGTYILPGIGTAIGSALGGMLDGAFGSQGGPKTEVYGGSRDTGWGLAQSAPVSAAVDALAIGVQAQFDATLARFDKTATLVLGIGGDADPQGTAGSRAGYALSVDGAKRFSEISIPELDGAAMAANASRALVAALEAADITRIIDGYLDSINVGTLTADQASSVIASILAFDTMADVLDELALGAGSASDELINAANATRKTATDANGARITESVIQSAARVMQETLGVSSALSKLGVDVKTAFPVDEIYGMSSALATLFGGIEGFNTQVGAYYSNFFSAEEKTKAAWDDMGKAFAAINQAMPTTREGFRAIVDGLDLTTIGGQATFKALMDLQGGFAALTPAIEEATKALAAARLDTATSAADQAMSSLERAVEAQRKIYEVQVSAAEDAVTEIRSVFDTIESSIKTLYGQADSAQQAAQGRAFIGNALSTAQDTGYLPESQALSEAIQAAINDSTVYASQADEQFAKLELAGSLSKLKTISGDQLTVVEKQLKAAQDQIIRLDDTLSLARQQLDAANGINNSVLSVTDAVRSLEAALGSLSLIRAEQGLKTTAGATAAVAREGEIRNYMTSLQGDTSLSDAGRAITLASRAAEVGVSESEIAAAWGVTADDARAWFAAAGIPQFAVGTNYVPRDMVAQIHEGEAIVPKAYNPAAGGGVNNTARLEALVEGLTKEVQRLQGIVNDGNNHARRAADTLDNVTEGGSNMRTVTL